MNLSPIAVALLTLGPAAASLRADFTYTETTRITGGALVSMVKFAGAFSKNARQATEPTQSTVSIKGNRMVHKSKLSTTITDLDKETITTIDNDRKTYSVMTFAQMKEAMEQMSQRAQQQQQRGQKNDAAPAPSGDVQFDVKFDDTGNKKSINGNEAHEVIMTMTVQGSDAQSGAKGGMDVSTDMWIAPHVEGYQEVREFYKRMGEKLAWSADMNPVMAGRPDMARAMARMQKEGSKMDGMPVMQITKMTGKMEGVPASDSQNSQQQQQQQQQQQNSPPPTSISGALGGMLAGRMAKRKQADDSAQSGSASGSLMEMTTEVNSIQTGAADPSLFEVPAGYKLVERNPNSR